MRFLNRGYIFLGGIDRGELVELRNRIDDIMLGRANVDYEQLMMQLDRGDEPGTPPGPQTNGFKGATLAYRKIQNLEINSTILSYMTKPIFREACSLAYGSDAPISCFRAMFMNKPAGLGTELRWHQDRWANLDRDPLITIWTTLDDATLDNGCVRVIPGSHRAVLNPDDPSGFLTDEMAEEFDARDDVVPLAMEAGEVVLLHNHLLHTSSINRTNVPRRAISVCYMDARTVDQDGTSYRTVFDGEKLTGVTGDHRE